MDDKVSIVIPVYNSEKFLENTIKSILDQSYQNIEIIAVDDGSTDNSVSILEKFSESIIILKQKHSGLGNSLNLAINHMTGNWFKWVSPDDLLYPEYISEMINVSKNLPENTILYSNWIQIDHKNNFLRNFYETNYNSLNIFDFNVRLLDGQQINVNTTLIPKKLFDLGCTFQNLSDYSTIDYDFFLRAGILFNTKFFLVEKPLLKYRIHKSQLSHQNISNILDNANQIKENILLTLHNSSRNEYIFALKQFQNDKSIIEKLQICCFNIINKLPSFMNNFLINYYLKKIRTYRSK